jgi:shikimate dehydrogenase
VAHNTFQTPSQANKHVFAYFAVITGQTRLLGVIGSPIAHTLSPVMHNAALAILQQQQPELNAVYLPFAVQPEQLEQAIAGFAAIGVEGFNVTIPHKQSILPFLSQVSAIAQTVGAVNTVWRTEQGWAGTNTDVQGFLAPLRAYQRDWQTALILGSGGAARAVVAGCVELGFSQIVVVGRNQNKLDQFAQSWQNLDPLTVYPWSALGELLPQATLLMNATPIGMHPQSEQSPLTQQELALLPANALVYDLIYTPRPTLFLQHAQSRGLAAIDGLEMLVQQGAAALEIWLQQPVPVAAMRQAAEQHLKTKY